MRGLRCSHTSLVLPLLVASAVTGFSPALVQLPCTRGPQDWESGLLSQAMRSTGSREKKKKNEGKRHMHKKGKGHQHRRTTA